MCNWSHNDDITYEYQMEHIALSYQGPSDAFMEPLFFNQTELIPIEGTARTCNIRKISATLCEIIDRGR